MLTNETIKSLSPGQILFDSKVEPHLVTRVFTDKIEAERVVIRYTPKLVKNKVTIEITKRDLELLFFETTEQALMKGLFVINQAKLTLLKPKFNWAADPRADEEWYANPRNKVDPAEIAREIESDWSKPA